VLRLKVTENPLPLLFSEPGWALTRPELQTEALGLFEVQRYLVSNGFKVTEIRGRLDDGSKVRTLTA
jgi:hypothetical protein